MAAVGEQIKAAREANGISLEKAASDLKISKRHLESLEEGNYGSFPAQIYVRGFLSNYSKYLGLDPKSVLEQYSKLMLPERESYESPLQVKKAPRRLARNRVAMLAITLLIIIVCLIALYFLRPS